MPLARQVAGNVYGNLEAWDGWSPAPLIVRAEFRYDSPVIAGAGTGTFAWLPTWCRVVDYDPDVWACKFL